jgi:hydroxymethylpyrimidine pyrophosphatase-like HAD family hydrolase
MTTPENGHPQGNRPDNPEHTGHVDFDAGAFTIPFLAADPEGFVVATDHQLTRREPDAPGDAPLLSAPQQERLRHAMQDEIRFQGGEKVSAARAALRGAQEQAEEQGVATDPDELGRLAHDFDQARQQYVRGMAGKVGLRNVTADGGTLTTDVKFVSFPVYTELSRPENSSEILDLSSLAGVAMAVRTTDDRLVIQHRAVAKQRLDGDSLSRGNRIYPDIPGASVAGMLDATVDSADRPAGAPDAVDTDAVRAAILKESFEELGTGLHDYAKLRVVGLAHDNIAPHDEFLLLTDARITAAQLREQSRSARRNQNLGDADFEEKFIDIEASPEAIETLLTDVKCPLPPTHAALMVASGYSMMLERGVDEAEAWKARLEQAVRENYRQIDGMVAGFYQRQPEALERVPERYWDKPVPPRNPHGYSSDYTPEEQGLPNFDDEMVRTGLMPETRRVVPEAWLFDVDGPLTDPKEHKVTEPELLDIVARKLEAGEPVGLNTGREVEWVMERFVGALTERLNEPAALKNMIIIGEMGGTWAVFDADGQPHFNQSQQLSIPEALNDAIKQLVEQEYGDAMTFADERRTMASVIMREGYDLKDFDRLRLELGVKLHELVEESGQADRLHIGQTTIATDIQVKHAGKDLGADRFLEWLSVRGIRPEHVTTFGDSASDIEMAEELNRRGRDTTFVFVGENPVAPTHPGAYPVIHEPGFSSATLKVLKSKK